MVRCGAALLLLPALLTGCAAPQQPQKTAQPPVTEVEVEQPREQKQPEEKEILIAIDPGHQSWEVNMSALEPNAPGSSVMKAKATTGTAGTYSGTYEYELNLDIAQRLRQLLERRSIDSLLTREDNQTAISNAERAMVANEAEADLLLRIHANGSEDPNVHGALALVPSPQNPYNGSLSAESERIARTILDVYCRMTGFTNLGIQYNDTMTGINWSERPVVILEMGFMTNEGDDLAMADDVFRQTMAAGIAEGIEAYFDEE